MPIVANPLPFVAPDLPGTDRSKLELLWISAERCAQILRAVAGGRLIEWHEDEELTSTTVLIQHNLGRRPRFCIQAGIDAGRTLIFYKEQSSETRVALALGAGTAKVSFLLL